MYRHLHAQVYKLVNRFAQAMTGGVRSKLITLVTHSFFPTIWGVSEIDQRPPKVLSILARCLLAVTRSDSDRTRS